MTKLLPIGTRVVLTGDNHGFGTVGDVGVIESIGQNNDYWVRFDYVVNGTYHWWVGMDIVEREQTTRPMGDNSDYYKSVTGDEM